MRRDGTGNAVRKHMMTPVAALLAQSVAPPAPRASDLPWPRSLELGTVPLEMREVFWSDRSGRLRHQPIAFAGERPIEGAAFYRAVGRADLAAEYERRDADAQLVGGAGLFIALAGTVGVVKMKHDAGVCDGMAAECPPANPALAAASLVGTLVGGPMLVTASYASPEPVSADVRRSLVNEHNRRLSGGRPLSLEPTAMVSSQQALVGLGGRF